MAMANNAANSFGTLQDGFDELDHAFYADIHKINQLSSALPKPEKIRVDLWIEKLLLPCAVPSWKKNRNLYAQILLLMVQRKKLEAPFDKRPPVGELETLPTYMTMYLTDKSFSNSTSSSSHGASRSTTKLRKAKRVTNTSNNNSFMSYLTDNTSASAPSPASSENLSPINASPNGGSFTTRQVSLMEQLEDRYRQAIEVAKTEKTLRIRLEEQLRKMEETCLGLRKRCEVLEKLYADIKTERDDSAHQQLAETVAEWEAKLREANERKATELRAVEKERDDVIAQTKELERRLEETVQQCATRVREITETAERERAQLEQELAAVRQQCADVETFYKTELDTLRRRFESEVLRISNEGAGRDKEWMANAERAAAENNALRGRCEALERELEEERRMRMLEKTRNEELHLLELDKLTLRHAKEMERWREEGLAVFGAKKEALETSLRACQERCEELEHDVDELHMRLKEERDKVLAAERKCAAVSEEKTKLDGLLAAEQENSAKLRQQLERLKENFGKLTAAVSAPASAHFSEKEIEMRVRNELQAVHASEKNKWQEFHAAEVERLTQKFEAEIARVTDDYEARLAAVTRELDRIRTSSVPESVRMALEDTIRSQNGRIRLLEEHIAELERLLRAEREWRGVAMATISSSSLAGCGSPPKPDYSAMSSTSPPAISVSSAKLSSLERYMDELKSLIANDDPKSAPTGASAHAGRSRPLERDEQSQRLGGSANAKKQTNNLSSDTKSIFWQL